MKATKYLIPLFLAGIILLNVNYTLAQGFAGLRNASPKKRAEFQTSMMKEKLNLDAQQEAKVSVINLKYAKKFEPILKSDGDKKERLKQAETLQDAKDLELKTVFTKEQYQQYQAFEQKLKSRLMVRLK
jgi:hypothetical protein